MTGPERMDFESLEELARRLDALCPTFQGQPMPPMNMEGGLPVDWGALLHRVREALPPLIWAARTLEQRRAEDESWRNRFIRAIYEAKSAPMHALSQLSDDALGEAVVQAYNDRSIDRLNESFHALNRRLGESLADLSLILRWATKLERADLPTPRWIAVRQKHAGYFDAWPLVRTPRLPRMVALELDANGLPRLTHEERVAMRAELEW